MNRKIVFMWILIIVCPILIVSLVSCNNANSEDTNSWRYHKPDGTLAFTYNDDGTFLVGTGKGTYTTEVSDTGYRYRNCVIDGKTFAMFSFADCITDTVMFDKPLTTWFRGEFTEYTELIYTTPDLSEGFVYMIYKNGTYRYLYTTNYGLQKDYIGNYGVVNNIIMFYKDNNLFDALYVVEDLENDEAVVFKNCYLSEKIYNDYKTSGRNVLSNHEYEIEMAGNCYCPKIEECNDCGDRVYSNATLSSINHTALSEGEQCPTCKNIVYKKDGDSLLMYDESQNNFYVEYHGKEGKKFYNTSFDDYIIGAYVADSVTVLDDGLFKNLKNLKYCRLSNTLKTTGKETFYYTGISEIEIPSSIEEIGKECFYGCSQLKNVKFQENSKLKIIQSYAFACPADLRNYMTTFTIPDSVEMMGFGVFKYCHSLENINISKNSKLKICANSLGLDNENSAYYKNHCEDGVHYLGKCAIYYVGEMSFDQKITIKEGTTSLASELFEGQKKLVKIELPNSVEYIGSSCFNNCTNLDRHIKLPNNIRIIGAYNAIEVDELFIAPSSLEVVAFRGISGAKYAVFSENLKYLGSFYYDDTNTNTYTKRYLLSDEPGEWYDYNEKINVEEIELTYNEKTMTVYKFNKFNKEEYYDVVSKEGYKENDYFEYWIYEL